MDNRLAVDWGGWKHTASKGYRLLTSLTPWKHEVFQRSGVFHFAEMGFLGFGLEYFTEKGFWDFCIQAAQKSELFASDPKKLYLCKVNHYLPNYII